MERGGVVWERYRNEREWVKAGDGFRIGVGGGFSFHR